MAFKKFMVRIPLKSRQKYCSSRACKRVCCKIYCAPWSKLRKYVPIREHDRLYVPISATTLSKLVLIQNRQNNIRKLDKIYQN